MIICREWIGWCVFVRERERGRERKREVEEGVSHCLVRLVCFEGWFIRYPRSWGLIKSEKPGVGADRRVCIAEAREQEGERFENIYCLRY